MEIWPGNPYPLGATYDGTGVNFALFTEVAERVELCLVGRRGDETRHVADGTQHVGRVGEGDDAGARGDELVELVDVLPDDERRLTPVPFHEPLDDRQLLRDVDGWPSLRLAAPTESEALV